jgi:CP family cyanate transporter-like MFS transporter
LILGGGHLVSGRRRGAPVLGDPQDGHRVAMTPRFAGLDALCRGHSHHVRARRPDAAIPAAARHVHPALLLAGFILIGANLRPAITAVGPLVGEIQRSAGLSAAEAGLLTTLPLMAFGALSLAAPPVARRLGTERALEAALILLAAGILLRSAGPLGAVFAGTAVLGAAIAAANVLLPGLIKQDFPERAGPMTSLYSTAMVALAGVGSAVSVPLAELGGLGWRGSLGCWAILAAVGAVVWLPQLRDRHVPPASSASGRYVAAHLWRSRLAWHVSVFMGLQSLVFFGLVAWLPDLLADDGLGPATAGLMLGVLQFGGLISTMTVPHLAGAATRQRGLVVLSTAACLVSFAGLLAFGSSLALLWSLLLGLATGAYLSLALMFLVTRAADARHTAALSGMAQAIGYLIAATGPITIGALHDLTGSWTVPLLVFIAVTLGALATGLGAARNVPLVRQVASPAG